MRLSVVSDVERLLFSIVIPIHNEEVLLEALVRGIVTGLQDTATDYELILSENGSSDNTFALAQQLEQLFPPVRLLSSPKPSYGHAIKQGILHSNGETIIIFNADLWDLSFLRKALELLKNYDMVIASKRHHDSQDQRPFKRRFITWGFNRLLWLMFGFQGTDTHGMKAFRRRLIVPVVERCITEREIFDTEVILRAQQAGLTTIEVPAVVEEMRPSRYSPFVRIPRTLKDLGLLYRDLYLLPQSKPFSSESEQL